MYLTAAKCRKTGKNESNVVFSIRKLSYSLILNLKFSSIESMTALDNLCLTKSAFDGTGASKLSGRILKKYF